MADITDDPITGGNPAFGDDAPQDDVTPPAPDKNQLLPDPKVDPKQESRTAFDAREARKQAEALRKELDGYKRREEDARKAALTETQLLKEQNDELMAKFARMEAREMQTRIAAEFQLPAALAARLIGTDEDALRADAQELQSLLPPRKVGSATDPARDASAPKARIYTRAELAANPALARSAEVRQAAAEGRIR